MTKRDRVGGWVKNGYFRRDVIMQWPLTGGRVPLLLLGSSQSDRCLHGCLTTHVCLHGCLTTHVCLPDA